MNFLIDPAFAIYMAMLVALIVWLGIFAYLWRLDRQVRELRQRLDAEPVPERQAPRVTIEPRQPDTPVQT